MKTILFPTDFSENATHASMYAAAIADKSTAQLILYFAFWVPVYEADTPLEIILKEKQYKNESLKDLGKLEKKIKETYPNISISLLTSNGFPADAIATVAQENNVDLIVMGTKGASGLREVIMGGNTVDVINKVTCPVLAIPQKVKEIRFNKLVFASNFSEHDIEDIAFLIEFGKLFDSEITITHVTEDEDFIINMADQVIIQKMKSDVKAKTPYEKLKYKLLRGDVIDELHKFIESHEVDLLSMVTTKKHFLSKLFNKSYTQKMAFHIEIPLLVLRHSHDK